MLVLVWAGLLAACGETTPVSQNGLGAATATAATTSTATTIPASATPTQAIATVTPTTQRPATVTPAAATPITTHPATATATAEVKPVIRFSAVSIKVGETMTVSGSGYPANTKLNIALTKNNSSPFGSYATPTTDAKGSFSTPVKFDGYDHAKALDPGEYRVLVSVAGGGPAASAPLTLRADEQATAADLEQARATLSKYLNALNEKRYTDAARLYRGDPQAFVGVLDQETTDRAKLFELGCAANGLKCLPVKSISQGKKITEGQYEFMVELLDRDGQLLKIWPAGAPEQARTKFAYTVVKTPDGFGVTSLPPFTP